MKKPLLQHFLLFVITLALCAVQLTVPVCAYNKNILADKYSYDNNSKLVGLIDFTSDESIAIIITVVLLMIVLLIITVVMINRQHKVLNNMREQAVMLDMLTSAMNAGLKVSEDDDRKTLTYVNENLCRLIGYSHDEIMSMTDGSFIGLIYPEDVDSAIAEIDRCFENNNEYQCEYRMRRNDGVIIWIQDAGRKFVDTDGVTRINSVLTDITELKEAMETLRLRAEYDELTGIYNKPSFNLKSQELINNNPDETFAVAAWNIERFKVINDLFGTDVGDKVLNKLAMFFKSKLKGHGTFCRLESDHFVTCIRKSEFDVQLMLNQLDEYMNTMELEHNILVNLGIYVTDKNDVSVNQMTDRAFVALQTIKGNYMKRYAYYDNKMLDSLIADQTIVNEMNKALTDKQFDIYLQPQYNHSTGKICGAEALVRWLHPEKGLIPPYKFIPVFEKNGFITNLDEYVWDRTCQLIRSWMDNGMNTVPLSVNISRLDIYNPQLCNIFADLLAKYRLSPDCLRLEITESAYVENPEQLIDVVANLQSMGFKVEMDDFGSGYSSLNTLKEVPVDVLKLDMRFLSGKDVTGRGGNILNSIIRMAKWLNLSVVAEGVETQKQADYLKSIGCSIIQGYFYSKPVPVDVFNQVLARTESETVLDKGRIIGLIDANDFWDPEGQMALIFNSFVGGAAVFEYYEGKMEILRVNDKFYEQLGIDVSDFGNMRISIKDILVDESVDVFIKMLENSIVASDEASCEVKAHVSSDIWLNVKVRCIARSDLRYIFYMNVENITEKKELENKLGKTTVRLEAIMKNIQGGISLSECDGDERHLIYANDSFYSLFGYTASQFADKITDTYVLCHADDRDKLRRHVNCAIADNSAFTYEHRIIRCDGSAMWVQTNTSVIRQDGEKPIILSMTTDISQMREHTQRLNIIMEYIPFAIALVNVAEGVTVEFANNRFFEQNGYSAADVINKMDILQIVHSDDRANLIKTISDAIVNSCNEIDLEYRVVRRDGSIKWTRLHAEKIVSPLLKEALFLAVFEDIGNLKQEFSDINERLDNALTENKRYKTYCNNLSYAVMFLGFGNSKISINDYNDTAMKILGYHSREEFDSVCEQGFFAMVSKESAEKAKLVLGRVLISHCNEKITVSMRSKDGSKITCHGDLGVCNDENNNSYIQFVFIDE